MCLQGVHSCYNGEDREARKTVPHNVVSVTIKLWKMSTHWKAWFILPGCRSEVSSLKQTK